MENFREAPQNDPSGPRHPADPRRLHPDRHFALGHDCGIYWKLTDPPVARGQSAPTGSMSRACRPCSTGTIGVVRPVERERPAGRHDRVCLGGRQQGARPDALRGQVLDLRAGGPGPVLWDLRGRHRGAGGLSSCERGLYQPLRPNERGITRSSRSASSWASGMGSYQNEVGPVAALVRRPGESAAAMQRANAQRRDGAAPRRGPSARRAERRTATSRQRAETDEREAGVPARNAARRGSRSRAARASTDRTPRPGRPRPRPTGMAEICICSSNGRSADVRLDHIRGRSL